jgi:hypothetical protein
MAGIIGIIASLTVLSISLVITRLATTALQLTGLSRESASFQARSAFTGTGFTTTEAEKVVGHPVRRKIITWLMVARSAGFVSIIISLILSFDIGGNENEIVRLYRLGWLILGVLILWFLARSKHIESWMNRWMAKLLNRWTELDIFDYSELLKLSGDYGVRKLKVKQEDWLAGKKLNQCELFDEGVTILGIHRDDGSYLGAPQADSTIYPGDVLVLYGQEKTLNLLSKRKAGIQGEKEHSERVEDHEKEKVKQKKQESNYERKRQHIESG